MLIAADGRQVLVVADLAEPDDGQLDALHAPVLFAQFAFIMIMIALSFCLDPQRLCKRDTLARSHHLPTPDELRALTAAMNGGRPAEAAGLARLLLDRHPQLGFIWTAYGAALLRQGQDALPALQHAVQLSPDDADTHYYLATALNDRGDRTAAGVHYRRALALRPAHLPAIVGFANTLLESGRFAEAAAAYRQALAIEPASAELHNNLGNALRDGGELHAALASYGRALEIKPNFAAAHSNLGNAHRRLGQGSLAVASCRRALEIEPHFAEACNNLGNALRDLGRPQEAAASYRRALEIQPDFAVAYSNFGNVMRDLGRLQDALESYRQALQLRPQLAQAHNNLGNVFLDLMRLDEAAASYRQALVLKADYVHAHTGLAMALRLQGHGEAAEASCRRALQIAPNTAEAVAFLGEILADCGRFAEAQALFERAIGIDPDLPAAWAGLVRYRRLRDEDPGWLAAAQRLADAALPVRHEINLRYAMGKYFDDLQHYEEAFQNYRLANELTKTYGARHDRTRLTRQIDRIIKTCDRKWLNLARIRCAGSEHPIFIVGMPRSGTTLAEQILASHPAVFGAGELPFWNDAAAAFEAGTAGDAHTHDSGAAGSDLLTGFAQAYRRQLLQLPAGARRVVDKMPTNFMNVGLIHAALPAARIIHMRRNPADTCLSIYFQNFSISHAYANDLEDLAHYYREYLRVMAHWRETLPEGTMLDVDYEELVGSPQELSRKMLEFLDLPWDARCLEFHETRRTVTTPSKWQVRQRINSASSGRWRHYESHIGALRELLVPGARS
jgi:tetratricopeptide (TPR) repeat protein